MAVGEDDDAPALAPVSTATRREVVLDALRRALVLGELAPGQRVKESVLAATLGVSRPTVREAVSQMVHEGSLVLVPHKGISVAKPSPRDLLEVAEIRVSLESLAAGQAAKRAESQRAAGLRDALQAHLQALRDGDPVASDLTHLELHRAVWEGSENQLLMRVWPLVESHFRMAMTLDRAARDDPERDAEYHRRLVAVIEGGDEDAILEEVRDHIGRSADEVVRLLEREGPPT